jgi:hypothetical protein
MKYEDKPIDDKTKQRLETLGVWIGSKAPKLTQEQALVLIGQRIFDNFVSEFSRLWKKDLFPHCQVKDFEATEEDWQAWLGSDYQGPMNCKEVDGNMDEYTQTKLDEYLGLLETIRKKTGDERTAMTILQEISKDRRTEQIRMERETRNGGRIGDLATDRQRSFLKKLGIEFANDITKKQASFLIDHELGNLEE